MPLLNMRLTSRRSTAGCAGSCLLYTSLSGNDSLILKSLQAGGAGGIAGCSNVYPHVLSSIYNLFVEGKIDEAQAAQDSIASFRAVFK